MLVQIRAERTLASVVVFAAAIEPGDPPDVAVGLALAAHTARMNREKISLVVVPHYLESDLELEHELQSQHESVTGGIVLGQTPTVPEDTRALLRQMLTSTDRQGVLAQVQANLGSVGSLIAALLALVGLAAATRIAGPIVIKRLERTERIKHIERLRTSERKHAQEVRTREEPKVPNPLRVILISIMTKLKRGRRWLVAQKKSDWLTALGGNQEVTVWLRSGRQVTGTIEGQFPAEARDAAVFRIRKAPLTPTGADVSPPRPEGAYVLVSVKDIELIHFNDSG